MNLSSAINILRHNVVRHPDLVDQIYLSKDGFCGAGLYWQGEDKPLRYRRFPGSHGWDWRPSVAELASYQWGVRAVGRP